MNDIYSKAKKSEIRHVGAEIVRKKDNIDELRSFVETKSDKDSINIVVYRMTDNGADMEIISGDSLIGSAVHSISKEAITDLYRETKMHDGKIISSYRYKPELHAYIPINDNDNGSGAETVIYSLVERDSDGNELFFMLSTNIVPIGATVSTMNIILLVVGVLMVLMAAVMALVMSGIIAKPIIRINKTAKALAKGNYNVEFEGGSYREISELSDTMNYAAGELGKVDSLKRELIANTSHDLRTPLTMISGYAEIMRDLPGENTPENAQIIVDETARLSSLVNDMLDISKLESGTQTTAFEIFNLTDAVAETINRYNRFKTQEGFNITFYANESVEVRSDRSKILQALCNLINNAITYTGEDKRVDIHQILYNDQNGICWVRISVRDTGEGIPEDKLTLIWDRYYKLDATHRRSAQGSGLGLSIVNKLMTLIGGRCDVFSSVGEGSTFSIEIPIL